MTLQSPFFKDEYYPESHILKAITFHENCRYPEARSFLEEFKERYGTVRSEIDRMLGEDASSDRFFQTLLDMEDRLSTGESELDSSSQDTLARVLRLAMSDTRLKDFRKAIREIDQEKEEMNKLPGSLLQGIGSEAMTAMAQRRGEIMKRAGQILKIKLKREQEFLTNLSSQLSRIEFEISKGEKSGLEAQIRNEGQAVPLKNYKYSAATDDERVYYPFDGEYWRDELGTYEYTLTHGCREGDG